MRRLAATVTIIAVLAAPAMSTAVAADLPASSPATPSAQHSRAPMDELTGVSCPGATMCMAVGSHDTDFNALPLAERWDGADWSVVPAPNPVGALASDLFAVTCPTVVACTGVGFYSTRHITAPLVERWNGSTWTVVPSPIPSRTVPSDLLSVSCARIGACAAVGCYFDGNIGCRATLAESWNGTRWVVEKTPSTGLVLHSVSCTAADSCMAVGSKGTGGTLAERWNGKAWSVIPSPNPTSVRLVDLLGVSCSSSAACFAVGTYADQLGNVVTLAARWDGTRWTIVPSPNPRGGEIILSGVACISATACSAVGNYQTGTGTTFSFAERWNGAKLTLQTMPQPAGASVDGLFGIACSGANACAAVGSDVFDSNGDSRTLIERWDGESWTIQPSPNPTTARARR